MIVMPAIDLRDGACVQLVGGSYDDERVRLDDPVAVARRWVEVGFRHLHVVDLDAALERGSNAEVIERILAIRGLDVQVGGGVRSGGAIARLLNAGARRVVLGTRAIEEPDWIEATSRAFPNTIVVAVDARGHHIVTRGWTRALETDVRDRVVELSRLPLAGVLFTAVHREGRMAGVDLELAREVIEHAALPVQIAGGVSAVEDLRALESAGAAAAIAGMALYTGRLDPQALVAEFGARR